MGCKTIFTSEPAYSFKPHDVYHLTVPELLNLAHKVVSNMYVRGNRGMHIPQMAEKQDAKRTLDKQERQLDEMVEQTWDTMFPKV